MEPHNDSIRNFKGAFQWHASYAFSGDGTLSPNPRYWQGMSRGRCTMPQDRMSLYGGSLATGRPGTKHNPSRCGRWYDYADMSGRDEQSDQHWVLQQLVRLRSEANEAGVAYDSPKGFFLILLQTIREAETHSEILLGERLFAQVQFRDREDCEGLLSRGADPLFRDSAGNIPLHVASTAGHVRSLLQADPEMVHALNLAQQAPLSALIWTFKQRNQTHGEMTPDIFSEMLATFSEMCGLAPFFTFCRSSQSTPYGLLSARDRDCLKFPITWEAIQVKWTATSTFLLRSLQQLGTNTLSYPAAILDGIMHFVLLEEVVDDAQAQQQRLRQLCYGIQTLMEAGAHECHEESVERTHADACSRMARWLLTVSGSTEMDARDPRRQYRSELAISLAELYSRVGASLDEAYDINILRRTAAQPWSNDAQDRLLLDNAHWLQSTPPLDSAVEKRMVTLEGYGRPILRGQLRLVDYSSPAFAETLLPSHFSEVRFEPAISPEWLREKDLNAALEDLRYLGETVSTISLMNVVAIARCTDDDQRLKTALAWLHAARVCRLHEIAKDEMRNALEKILCRRVDAAHVNFPAKARNLEDVWRDAQDYWEVCGFDQTRPADFVCDITCTSAVFKDISTLRACYMNIEKLNWNCDGIVLIRTANGFHRGNVDPRGRYRSCVIWVAISTSVGPLVAQVDLELETFHERREIALLLADCIAGLFEPERLRKAWSQLLHALSELCSAIRASSEQRVRIALKSVEEILNYPELIDIKNDLTMQRHIAAAEEALRTLSFENHRLQDHKISYEACLESRLAQQSDAFMYQCERAPSDEREYLRMSTNAEARYKHSWISAVANQHISRLEQKLEARRS